MPAEFLIVEDGARHGVNGQNTVKPLPLRLLREIFDDIARHDADAPRVVQRLIGVDAPHLFPVHILLHPHRGIIVHVEAQHVSVPDGIDDGVGVQRTSWFPVVVGLSTEKLRRSQIFAATATVDGKDGRSRETEHHVFLHPFGDDFVHVAELTPVTLVEYQHDVLPSQYLAQLFVLIPRLRFHQVRQFLYGRNDDTHIIVFQLFLENLR